MVLLYNTKRGVSRESEAEYLQFQKINDSVSEGINIVTKGMRPYIKSAKGGGGWSQGGKNITYTKLRKIYSFCDENEPMYHI